jgi:hypothetical protein
MYQKDFILRIIEDFFRFLSIILKLKEEKDYTQAFEVIRETSEKLLKIDVIALSEDEDDFNNFLTNTPNQPEKLEILAELLKIKAEIHLELNQVFSAINAFEKSLRLFDQCQFQSKNYSIDRVKKMTDINLQLDRLREPLKTTEV